MSTPPDRSRAPIAVPTIGALLALVVVGLVPFLPQTPAPTETLPNRLLLGVALVGLAYLLVSAWRVYAAHGFRAAVRWVLTGSVPRR